MSSFALIRVSRPKAQKKTDIKEEEMGERIPINSSLIPSLLFMESRERESLNDSKGVLGLAKISIRADYGRRKGPEGGGR